MSNLAMVKFRESTGAQRKEFFESVGWENSSNWAGFPSVELRNGDCRVVAFVDDGICSNEYMRLHESYISWINLRVPPMRCLFEVNLMARELLNNGLFFTEEVTE